VHPRSIKLISAGVIASFGIANTLVFGVFTYNTSSATIRAGYDRDALLIVDRVVDTCAYEFNLTEKLLSLLAEDPQMRATTNPFDGVEIARRLAVSAGLMQDAEYLVFARSDGRYIFSDRRVMPLSYDPRNQAWYRSASSSDERFSWSEPNFDYSNQTIVISVSTGLRGSRGELLGVVAAIFPISRIGKDIDKFNVGDRGLVMLLSDRGQVIASRADKYIGRSVLADHVAGSDASERFALRMDSQVYEVHVRRLAPNDMRVAVGISEQEIESASWRNFFSFFGIEIVGIAIFCVLTYILVRRGVAPIGHLISLMKKTEEGNYCIISELDQYAEIAALSQSFNRMVKAVNARDQILHKREKQIQNLAYYDNLTGLPNRIQLAETLSRTLRGVDSGNGSGALFYIDLDRFKVINDRLGHSVGDQVLKEIASRLSENLRPGQMAARLGGDEFILLLPRLDSVDVVKKVARRFLEILKKPVVIQDKTLDIGGSIGIVFYPLHGGDGDTLLKKADLAMYHAKRHGKHGFQIYEEHLQREVSYRLNIETGLREALSSRSFYLAYQPQYNMKEKRICGFEALLRCDLAGLVHIPVSDIIQVAEESGLIVEIERNVITEASDFARRINSGSTSLLPVSINLSAVHILQSDFVETFFRILDASGAARNLVRAEITETTLLDLKGPHRDKVSKLAEMGIAISLDDFGTGYSSLNYLQNLPIDTVKIDKSFVDELDNDERKANITSLIIQLSHGMGLSVVVEGVEREKQFLKVMEFGCDIVQGFYISPPLNEADAVRCLANWTSPDIVDTVVLHL
jgi:diguanylate cyclase (GGDEF)-like protein